MQEQKRPIKELRREAQGALLSKLLILEHEINKLDLDEETKSKIDFVIGEMRKLCKSYSKVLSSIASIVFCHWHGKDEKHDKSNLDILNNICAGTIPELYKIYEKSE